MLHGCTQNPDDFALGTRMHQLARPHQYVVVYPGQPSHANAKSCWNWFQAAQQKREGHEVSRLVQLTLDLIQRYSIPNHRVFVAGMSAGGAMAAILAHTYPDLFRALGVHSGMPAGIAGNLISGLAAMRGLRLGKSPLPAITLPTIVFQGAQDKVVHPSNAQRLVETVTGRASQSVSQHADHSLTRHVDDAGRVRVEFWSVHALGHAWSGGSPLGSYTEPSGPNASHEIMRFFLDHSEPQSA